jgi:hypothetical protein
MKRERTGLSAPASPSLPLARRNRPDLPERVRSPRGRVPMQPPMRELARRQRAPDWPTHPLDSLGSISRRSSESRQPNRPWVVRQQGHDRLPQVLRPARERPAGSDHSPGQGHVDPLSLRRDAPRGEPNTLSVANRPFWTRRRLLAPQVLRGHRGVSASDRHSALGRQSEPGGKIASRRITFGNHD